MMYVRSVSKRPARTTHLFARVVVVAARRLFAAAVTLVPRSVVALVIVAQAAIFTGVDQSNVNACVLNSSRAGDPLRVVVVVCRVPSRDDASASGYPLFRTTPHRVTSLFLDVPIRRQCVAREGHPRSTLRRFGLV